MIRKVEPILNEQHWKAYERKAKPRGKDKTDKKYSFEEMLQQYIAKERIEYEHR